MPQKSTPRQIPGFSYFPKFPCNRYSIAEEKEIGKNLNPAEESSNSEMWESENEWEIEVRSLNGESITVSIEPNKTVQDLKTILKNQFHPAASSPNFHLFLKVISFPSLFMEMTRYYQ